MHSVRLLVVMLTVTTLSFNAQAEVYKWKDKDGVMRYSDTPPMSNIKTETVVKKKAVNTPSSTAPSTKAGVESKGVVMPETPDEAAQRRRDQAEMDKRNKQEKEAELQRKADNCIAAKSNMEAYKQGGRVYQTNEKGERIYMDDKAFELGRQKAQREINDNC